MSIASSPPTLRLTPEQEAIVATPPSSTLLVMAGAGTGKTSTLVEYARRWDEHRGIYLAFNTDIAREAKEKFPRHIEVRTMHSFAYRELGIGRFKDQLQPGAIRRQQLREAAEAALGAEGARMPAEVLRRISWGFRRYLISDDPKLTHEHMPPLEGHAGRGEDHPAPDGLPPERRAVQPRHVPQGLWPRAAGGRNPAPDTKIRAH